MVKEGKREEIEAGEKGGEGRNGKVSKSFKTLCME